MEFKEFNKLINEQINMISSKHQLFNTDINVWDVYINSFSNEGSDLALKFHAEGMEPYNSGSLRQEHNGYFDKRFLDRYGNIAYIEGNTIKSALFNIDHKSLGVYANFVKEIKDKFKSAGVTWFFCEGDSRCIDAGTEFKGGFDHFHTVFNINDNAKLSVGIEQMKMLKHWAGYYKKQTVDTAIELAEDLYRPEKYINNLKWFGDFQEAMMSKKGNTHLWNMLSSVPLPYAHIKQGVIGSLLTDIQSDLPLADVASRFNSRMDSMKYQRQQAEINDGQIKAARKFLSDNGYMQSMQRRFASIDDLKDHKLIVWSPLNKTSSNQDFFSSLEKDKFEAKETGVVKDIRISKFLEDILPNADVVKVTVGNSSFYQFTTVSDPNSKNIFKWDNPVCGFFYNGSLMNHPHKWGLTSGQVVSVIGVANHQDGTPMFLIDAKTPDETQGGVIFPETLHHSLHNYRKAIEAASKESNSYGAVSNQAIGLNAKGLTVQVESKGLIKSYKLIDVD